MAPDSYDEIARPIFDLIERGAEPSQAEAREALQAALRLLLGFLADIHRIAHPMYAVNEANRGD